MVDWTTIGKEFGGLVRYQYTGRRNQPTDKKPEILASSGVSTESAAEMISDFNLGRAVNPKLGFAVWHTSLSFNPDDAAQLDSAKMLAIAEGYLQKMGLDNTQYVIVRHHDQPDNQHLHIIANRVDNDGKTIDDGRNFYRSKLARQELIAEHELTPTKGQRPELQHPERLRGTDLARHELLTIINRALATETQRSQLLVTLQEAGVKVKERFNKEGKATGISFEKDGYSFKGSELGRHLSSAAINKQLTANELKHWAAAPAPEAITAHLPLALAASASTPPFSFAKAGLGEESKVSAVQTQLGVGSSDFGPVVKPSSIEDGQVGANSQQSAVEQTRLNEQAVAAVAAFQREKKLIANYEAEARQAEKSMNYERMLQLRCEDIYEANKRLAAYEAEAKSTPFGLELLAKQEKLHLEKALKEEYSLVDLVGAQSSGPVLVSKQQTVIATAVESVTPAEPVPTSSAVLELLTTPLPIQQPLAIPVVIKEVPASREPFETTPAVVPHHAVAAQMKDVVLHPTAKPEESKEPPASLIKAPTSMPDPATGLTPPVPTRRRKAPPLVPAVETTLQQSAGVTGPAQVTSPLGLAQAARAAANHSPLDPAVPAVPTAVVPPVAQPPQSPGKAVEQLPAMSLAESLIAALSDLPAATGAVAPVVVTEAVWQHGIIRMQASGKGTSDERLSAVRAALITAGATVGEIVPPTAGRNVVALLPYSFDPAMTGLEKVTEVLGDVQASGNSKVQEQLHSWHQPNTSPGDESLNWPEREGQFNQARILIKNPNRGQTDAEAIAAGLRSAGAQVSEIKRDDQGQLVMQVTYHTHTPGIDAINEELDRAANKSTSIRMQESRENQRARYEGAETVTTRQRGKENRAQQER